MKEKTTTEQTTLLQKSNDFYKDIIAATIPLIIMAVYLYGVRALALVIIAVLTSTICDRLAAIMRKKPFEKMENGSTAAAIIFTLLLPASISYYVLILGVVVAIMLGKHAFGGEGVYPFNLAAVGYAIVAVGWPTQVFMYPQPMQSLPVFNLEGVYLTESASYLLKMGGLPNISTQNLLLGNYAGPMGTTFIVVIAACALFLIVRGHKIAYSAVGFLAMSALVAFVFPRVYLAGRLDVMRYEILSGSFFFAATFLLADPNTTPQNDIAQIIYGALLGFISMMFRYFGIFELGVCFALIITNTVSDFIDRTVKEMQNKTVKKPAKTGGKPK